MYLYETHLHTSPVSKCANASAREVVEFYKSLGYAGIFVTNHFIDGNISIPYDTPYEEKINFYFKDYEDAKKIGDEIGLDVFPGIEMSYKGTDFLIYGPDKEWYLSHPEIANMRITEKLTLLAHDGALIIQAHPFRESAYIEHIRLFPRYVHGVEIFNACRAEFENSMAKIYAKHYSLLSFAGSDNHSGKRKTTLSGVKFSSKITDVWDFVFKVKDGLAKTFTKELEK